MLRAIPLATAMTINKAEPIITKVIIAIVIIDFTQSIDLQKQILLKASPVLKPAPFRSRAKNLAEGNRGPGLYSSKYGKYN